MIRTSLLLTMEFAVLSRSPSAALKIRRPVSTRQGAHLSKLRAPPCSRFFTSCVQTNLITRESS